MKGNFLLISGTASRSCPPEQLARGIQFIELLTAEVLRAGGGLVVLLGDENRTKGADGNPRIFDWIIMRAIERYATNTIEPARTLAWVVISDDAWDRKMDDNNRRIFTSLQQRGVLEIERIRREEFTGGAYRRSECELADVMVALGGGKGTYSLGMDMIDLGKPVLPVDLEPVYDLFRINTVKASTTICRLVLSFLSQFFQSRRHFSSQAKDRSTTHRFGSTTKVCSSLRFTTSTEAPNRPCTAVAKGFPV